MSRQRTVSKPQVLKAEVEVFTKQQFNYKRNNSQLMSTCLTWDWLDQDENHIDETQPATYKSVQFVKGDSVQKNKQLTEAETQQQIKQKPITLSQTKTRAKSATKKGQDKDKSIVQKDYSKYEKTFQQLQEEDRKAEQRKDKIKDYIESMVPYSRNLTDSKFQQFYQKSAPLAYGYANTKQPTGGVIYGNHLRTFNVNPHDYQNNPKTYQSYTTALNFATRCKRDDSKHWKRLQKQLGKKLNLHQKNHTLQQGKQVVYVDVNDHNMFDVMRENLEFKKDYRDEIRKDEKNYEYQKQMKFKAQKDKFYRNKADKTKQNLQQTMASTMQNDRDEDARIGEQVIYKLQDKNGNVRLGADRHALTCFVDINFPQNDGLYTQELKSRYQIYPTEVDERHKNLAFKKIQNFEKSVNNVYPSHYLVPCSEQPQIQKMLLRGSQERIIPKTKRRN